MQKKLIRLFSRKITLVSYWTLDLFILPIFCFWVICTGTSVKKSKQNIFYKNIEKSNFNNFFEH